MIVVDKEFVKGKSTYHWWPSNEDFIFHGSGSTCNNLNIGSGGSDRNAAIALAVIVAVIIVEEATEITYHNIKGTNVVMQIKNSAGTDDYPLEWGVNRFRISEDALAGIEDGAAKVFLKSTGTRKVNIQLPTEGLHLKRDVHVLEFSKSGEIIIDGDRVKNGPSQVLKKNE